MPFHCTSPDSLYFILIQYNVNLNFTSTELILCKKTGKSSCLQFPVHKNSYKIILLRFTYFSYIIFKAQLQQHQVHLLFRQMRYLSADYISRHTH